MHDPTRGTEEGVPGSSPASAGGDPLDDAPDRVDGGRDGGSFIRAAMLAPLIWAVLTSPALGQLSPEAIEEADEDCLDCHTDLDADEREFTFPDGTVRSFAVNSEEIRSTIHGKILSCVSCHQAYDERHRGFPEESARAFDASFTGLCKRCHEKVAETHAGPSDTRPICGDCHSVHADTASSPEDPRVSRRCGVCHEEDLGDVEAGGHAGGISVEDRNADLPTCATCHPQHRSPGGSGVGTRLEATAECIECHSRSLLIRKYGLPDAATKSYGQDFHGITFQHLWEHPEGETEPEIMVCADCHGPHRVGPLTQSQLSEVCSRCHEDAGQALVGAWLGHDAQGPRNGGLVWLVRLLYYVAIPLVVIGLILNILLHGRYRYRHDPIPDRWARSGTNGRGAGAAPPSPLGRSVIRFRPVERAEHLMAMMLFMTLVLTGIPQSYPQSTPGSWIIESLGGISSTRLIHRVAGFCFATLAILHVARGIIGAVRSNRLPAIAPTRKDFRDAVRNLLHYIGKGERPKFGRFDYRQKFEYWGLFFGGILMTVTGMLLVFPEFFSHVIPGIFLAAARVAHGLEATLAVLVVATWHLYEVLLRPEIFPIDTTIFTGRMDVERLSKEHTLEYERLLQESVGGPRS